MYTTLSGGDTFRRADGGCEESITRSAFNRRVSAQTYRINQTQHKVYFYLGHYTLQISLY